MTSEPPLPPSAHQPEYLSKQLASLELEQQDAEREKSDPTRHDGAIAVDEQLAEAGNGAKGPLVKLEENEEDLYEGLEEPYSLDLEKKIEQHKEKVKARPAPDTRTDFWDESHNDDGFYVPQVNGPEDPPPEKLPFDELPMSDAAHENLNAILTLLTKCSTRVVVIYRKGASEEQTRKYTDRFDLVKGNPWALLKQLSHLRRGDVWRCTSRGDTLYHTPLAEANVYDDPTFVAEIAKAAKAAQEETLKKAMDEVDVSSKKHHFGVRLTALEKAFGMMSKLIKECEEQNHRIQLLLSLHEYEKHSAETVSFLRDNIGKHDLLLKRLMKAVFNGEKK